RQGTMCILRCDSRVVIKKRMVRARATIIALLLLPNGPMVPSVWTEFQRQTDDTLKGICQDGHCVDGQRSCHLNVNTFNTFNKEGKAIWFRWRLTGHDGTSSCISSVLPTAGP